MYGIDEELGSVVLLFVESSKEIEEVEEGKEVKKVKQVKDAM